MINQDTFLYWISERERIRIRKANKQSKPWTNDRILQSYRFCNVRRMDDKVSRWLLQHWYRPYFNHPLMVPAVALARFVNKPESLELITKVVFSKRWNADRLIKILRDRRDSGQSVFNGAYMVRGGTEGPDKISCVVDFFVASLKGVDIPTNSMKESCVVIERCYGFGSFMAGQVTADLRWARKGTWSDKKVWAPIGPGSRRGMNRLQGRLTNFNLKQEQFEEELREVSRLVQSKLPKIYKKLEAIDIQNCLCEFDKYKRVLLGEGRPKQLYQGV